MCPHALSRRSSSSTAALAPRGHHKPERIGHYELLPRRLGNPTTGACPCRSARTRATPAAAAPARQRASKRHAGWLSRVWAVLRGTVRRGTQPRPHTHTHAHSYQPVCIINTYYLTYPTPHTRDARLGRRCPPPLPHATATPTPPHVSATTDAGVTAKAGYKQRPIELHQRPLRPHFRPPGPHKSGSRPRTRLWPLHRPLQCL